MNTLRHSAAQANAFAELGIRAELSLRPLLYVTNRCPDELLKVRGREEVDNWKKNWQLMNKYGDQGDGSILNLVRCRSSSVRCYSRSYSRESLKGGGVMRVFRMIENHMRCMESFDLFVLMYAVVEDNYGLTVFFEPEKMDLYNFFTDQKRHESMTDLYAVRKILTPLAQCLDHMHSAQGIVHRNICSESVIIDDNGMVNLGDFSMSICLRHQQPSSIVGKTAYLAPELLQILAFQQMTGIKEVAPGAYDERIDIWAFGIVTYELYMQRFPFYGQTPQQMMEGVMRYNLFNSPKANKISEEAKDFIMFVLNPNPSDRPSAAEILDHPFIRLNQEVPQPPSGLQKAASASRKLLSRAITFNKGALTPPPAGAADTPSPGQSMFNSQSLYGSREVGVPRGAKTGGSPVPLPDGTSPLKHARSAGRTTSGRLLAPYSRMSRAASSNDGGLTPDQRTPEGSDSGRARESASGGNNPNFSTRPRIQAQNSLARFATVYRDEELASGGGEREHTPLALEVVEEVDERNKSFVPSTGINSESVARKAPVSNPSSKVDQGAAFTSIAADATPINKLKMIEGGDDSLSDDSDDSADRRRRQKSKSKSKSPAPAPAEKKPVPKDPEMKVVCGCFAVKAKPSVKYEV